MNCVLTGVTAKGKQRIKRDGDTWFIVEECLRAMQFAKNDQGPWLFLKSMDTGDTRWVRKINDKDFGVELEPIPDYCSVSVDQASNLMEMVKSWKESGRVWPTSEETAEISDDLSNLRVSKEHADDVLTVAATYLGDARFNEEAVAGLIDKLADAFDPSWKEEVDIPGAPE